MFPSEKKKETVEIAAEKEQEKKMELIDSIRPHRGHTLYKVNVKTREISEAEFEKQDINFADAESGKKLRRKVIIEKDHIYISALNKKNVVKKFPKFRLKSN